MSRLVRVDDGVDESNSNFLLVFLFVIVLLAVLALAFFWTSGYMGGPRVINVMPTAAPTQMMTPNTQGTQGAPGAPGAAGMGGTVDAGGSGRSGRCVGGRRLGRSPRRSAHATDSTPTP